MSLKDQVGAYIDHVSPELVSMADEIFDHPELPFEEYKASDLLCAWLEKKKFSVERGVGGVETSFKAVYENGVGGPTIGLLCEYDALPMGHACGHHLQGPGILGAFAALVNANIDKPYKLVVYGTPAEENLLGKVTMLNNGCFREMNMALMMHSACETAPSTRSRNGVSLTVAFHGVEAHDTATPWMVRSGLDAVILAINGIEYLRGHVKDNTRFFHTINDCLGVAGNKNQSYANATFAFRTLRPGDVADLDSRMRAVLEGAALMTGTKMEIERELRVVGHLKNDVLNDALMDNAKQSGAIQIRKEKPNGGSNDFALLSHLLPCACIYVAFAPEGTPPHSQGYLDAGKSEIGHQSLIAGAKTIAYTVVDYLCEDGLAEKISVEFREKKKWWEELLISGESC